MNLYKKYILHCRAFSVVKPFFLCYTELATQLHIDMPQACVIYFLVKTQALFRMLGHERSCVAAIGAVRFSVRGFGCALFCYRRKEK